MSNTVFAYPSRQPVFALPICSDGSCTIGGFRRFGVTESARETLRPRRRAGASQIILGFRDEVAGKDKASQGAYLNAVNTTRSPAVIRRRTNLRKDMSMRRVDATTMLLRLPRPARAP